MSTNLVVLHVHYVYLCTCAVLATPCSDERIPMTDCAAYTIVNLSSERPFASKETTAEADYENPDAIM